MRAGLPRSARVLALPLHGPRTGLEQQVRPESAEHRPVSGMRKELLLEGPQPQEEIEAEILLGIERIVFDARNLAVHDDGRQGARRQGTVAEIHVTVAALEARLVLHGYLGVGETVPRLRPSSQ